MMWWSASYIHVELGRLGGSHSQSWLGPPSSLSAQHTTYIVTVPGTLTTVLGWTLYRLWYTLTESKVVNMSWSAVSEDDSVTRGQLFYHPLATSSIFWPSSKIQGSGLRCWRDFSDLQNAALWWREYKFLKIRTMSNSMLADVEKLSLKILDLMLKTPSVAKVQPGGFWETFWLSPGWFIINEIWPLAARRNYHLTLSLCNNGPKLCCRAIRRQHRLHHHHHHPNFNHHYHYHPQSEQQNRHIESHLH